MIGIPYLYGANIKGRGERDKKRCNGSINSRKPTERSKQRRVWGIGCPHRPLSPREPTQAVVGFGDTLHHRTAR